MGLSRELAMARLGRKRECAVCGFIWHENQMILSSVNGLLVCPGASCSDPTPVYEGPPGVLSSFQEGAWVPPTTVDTYSGPSPTVFESSGWA